MGSRSKFTVYENPAVAEVLRERAIRPSATALLSVLGVFFAATWIFAFLLLKREAVVSFLVSLGVSHGIASTALGIGKWVGGVICLAAVSAVCKVMYLISASNAGSQNAEGRGGKHKRSLPLTEHQQALVGMASVHQQKGILEKEEELDPTAAMRQRPPRSKARVSSSPSLSPVLVPVHTPGVSKGLRSTGTGVSSPWGETFSSPIASAGQAPSLSPARVTTPVSQYRGEISPYGASPFISASPTSVQKSPSSPWGKDHHFGLLKDEVNNEEKLEEFLAEVQTKMVESSAARTSATGGQGYLTPQPTIPGVGTGLSPAANFTPRSSSSTPRSGPKRLLRMSPSTHKTVTSPKKGEWEFPLPMSMEQVAEALQKLGFVAQLEQGRDRLRQWFSGVLLDPLVCKLDTSHLQVMSAAARLGVSITVAQVGSISQNGRRVFAGEGASREWLSTLTPDDDVALHELHTRLLQALSPPPSTSTFGLQQAPQMVNPAVRECFDAVTEHQRLKVLMEGDWVKGLLPQSTWKAEYAVQRVRELAEGTCVKRYDFMGRGESYDRNAKRLTLELPSDSHLLVYLFCALLEHPQWMLHVDPTSHPSTQCGNNPLYVASMPHKDVFPEKYVAVLSHPPPVLHMGACVLAVSKHTPPVFALYWDKKLQFSLQGRTALWDATLLLCYRVKVAHAGVIRGINLGSSALNLLSLLESSGQNDSGR